VDEEAGLWVVAKIRLSYWGSNTREVQPVASWFIH